MFYFIWKTGDFPRGARLCWFMRLRAFGGLTRSGSALQHPITPQKWGENQMSESFIAGHRKGRAGLFLGPQLPQWRLPSLIHGGCLGIAWSWSEWLRVTCQLGLRRQILWKVCKKCVCHASVDVRLFHTWHPVISLLSEWPHLSIALGSYVKKEKSNLGTLFPRHSAFYLMCISGQKLLMDNWECACSPTIFTLHYQNIYIVY